MATSSKLKQKLLILSSAVLLIMVISLLLLMKRPVQVPEEGPSPRQRRAQAAATSSAEGEDSAPVRHPRRRTTAEKETPRRTAGFAREGDAAAAASDAGLTPRIAAKRAPTRVHTSAPMVIPSEIKNEKDPVRRAQLMKMHRVATARVKVSQLRRRQRLLRATLSRAKEDGSFSPERLQRARQNLRDLDTGLTEANKELEQAQAAAGQP